MDVCEEIVRIEKALKRLRLPVAELLRRAGVDSSQWTRWKAGKQTPLMSTWAKIAGAFDELMRERAAA